MREYKEHTTGLALWERFFSTFLFPFVLALTAVWLRVADLGGFLTVDEATTWVPNSYRFLRVLQSGDYAATPFMGHPAITTMWLGSAGVVLHRTLFELGILHVETYPLALALNRLPIALVNALGVLLGYKLLRRVFTPNVAALAAFFWATDPFILAFSRVIHMDVLMGTFTTLSILAAWYVWHDSEPKARRWAWLVFSGICAGLAILSKLPGIILYAMMGMMWLMHYWGRETGDGRPGTAVSGPRSPVSGPRSLVIVLLWGIISVATIVALWPTFWVDPMRVYQAVRYGVHVEGGSPHLMGNFFLGQENPAPGLLFYPVALAMRTTPWSLVGLLLLPWVMLPHKRHIRPAGSQPQQAQGTHSEHETGWVFSADTARFVATLSVFITLFIAGISLFPLKMNRYLVPIFPAVNILAAFGLIGSMHAMRIHTKGLLTYALCVALMLISLGNALWWHPYSIAYFNPLLGGARAGARTFMIGWGEGTRQVAEWLNARPDSKSVVTVSRLNDLLNPYLDEYVHARRDDDGQLPEKAGYLMVYYRHAQWGQLPAPYNWYHGHAVPLYKVTIHGVDYAWIYQVPRAMPHALKANFGSAMGIHGYGLDTSAVRSSGVLTLTMQWHVAAPIAEDYNLFVHVLNDDGERVGQLDVQLRDPHEPTSAWQAGRFVWWVHPVMVPADMPPGRYRVVLGVYRPQDFSRLPLTLDAEWQAEHDMWQGKLDDGAHALFLKPVQIESLNR